MKPLVFTLGMLCALAAPARAQQDPPDGGTPPAATSDRPSEDALFGAGSDTSAPSDTQPAAGKSKPAAAENPPELIPGIVDRFANDSEVDDPLSIGGLFYSQFLATSREGVGLVHTTVSAPTLVDGYLDARPTDRLRAFLAARLKYDPLIDPSALAAAYLGQRRSNPSIVLDQLWLNFDIARTVFVTAGKQHVKWGTSRFWNPTDFLHPVRRDALALFDERTGTSMIKLHVPVESTGANFYGIAMFDDSAALGTLGGIGAGGRAEFVVGTTELGLDALVQNDRRPKYGFDLSSAVGPFDVYGELALRNGPYTHLEPTGPVRQGDYSLAASGGFNWTVAWRENDTLTLGAEYFYNQAGYPDSSLYPTLLLQGGFQPFYTGQHYAALYVLLPGPGDGEWDKTNFVLSNLANLSDRSYVTRLDFTIRVLRQLTVEANASVFYGNPDGEFRLRLQLPPVVQGGQVVRPPITIPPQRFSMGLALRMEF